MLQAKSMCNTGHIKVCQESAFHVPRRSDNTHRGTSRGNSSKLTTLLAPPKVPPMLGYVDKLAKVPTRLSITKASNNSSERNLANEPSRPQRPEGRIFDVISNWIPQYGPPSRAFTCKMFGFWLQLSLRIDQATSKRACNHRAVEKSFMDG